MSVQYSSQKNFNHSNLQKIGILLVNLGTPDAPSLKKYSKHKIFLELLKNTKASILKQGHRLNYLAIFLDIFSACFDTNIVISIAKPNIIFLAGFK